MSLRHTPKIAQHLANTIVANPAIEPVSLSEMQTHLSVDDDDENGLLIGFIEEAREEIEHLSGVAMITQSWKMSIDAWPNGIEPQWDGVREGALSMLAGANRSLNVPRFPLQSVTSVTTYATDSTATAIVVADTFDIDAQSIPPRITLKSGATWPQAMRSTNAIEIVYVIGFGLNSQDVPRPLRRAVKNLAAYLYAHRGDGCEMGDALKASGAQSIIEQYKVRRL